MVLAFVGANYPFPTYPQGALAEAPDGSFYGTASHGGLYLFGAIFRVTKAGDLTTVFSFNRSNGANPISGLTLGRDGAFYGTTADGGSSCGCGTVFRFTTNGTLTTLVSFDGKNGYRPNSRLLRTSDGTLYGTTGAGGSVNEGTVFEIGTNGAMPTLVSFAGTDGSMPMGVTEGKDGLLYGVAQQGGTMGSGQSFAFCQRLRSRSFAPERME